MTHARILVVDDEKGVVHSCVRILELQGFTVLGKTDAQTVPDLLRQESFDLLLTDIRMPKIDGLKLLQIAQEIDPHLTVILITGYGTMDDAIKAMRLGAQGFIMKPFEPADLIATIEDSLKRRALVRDSLRLQTLLPLLEINQSLQISGGETSLAQRVLEIAYQQTKATRLAWLSCQTTDNLTLSPPTGVAKANRLVETVVIPMITTLPTQLPQEAIEQALAQVKPIWVSIDGNLIGNLGGQPNIMGAVLPMIIKGEVIGLLMAETGVGGRTGPFDKISLDLLSVLAGQLTIIIENIQLFQQIRTLHAFNADIIRTMTNGLIAVNHQGHITAFNPAAAAMLGQDAAKILQSPMQYTLFGAEALVQVLQQTLHSGQAQAHQEIVIQHWDGTQLPIAVSVAPLTGGDEQHVLGVVGVLEDLSEIKTLEAERRRLDRLAALGEMSAVVAHEIRNPVAGIAAGIEYLTRKISEDSPDFAGAKMIQGEIVRVNRILEDILFVARPLQLNVSAENLPNIIDEVIQRCQPQITASQLEITSHHAADLPLIKVDRQRLEQVFSNLIINATQAMHGEKLILHTKLALPKNGKLSDAIIVTIEDTGPGIPSEIHRRIFDPFFTTKTRGTGLGLTVARRIIEEHKGTIHIESKPKRGTRFIITLPIGQEGE